MAPRISAFIVGALGGAVAARLIKRRSRPIFMQRKAVPLQPPAPGQVPRLTNSAESFVHRPIPDQIVKERVRAQLNRAVSHSGGIAVAVTNGQVTLSGQVAETELVPAVNAVQSIEGVRAVANRMKIVGTHEATTGRMAPPHRSIS